MSGEWTPELEEWIQARAANVGFEAAGIAAAEGLDDSVERRDAERFEAWVEAGRAGEMEYLKRRDGRGVLLRSGVQIAIPWARSVIVCALNYNSDAPRSIDNTENSKGWIAKYAWSGKPHANSNELVATDYHDELMSRLRAIESALRDRIECETRCYVDTGPLVERTAAARAGVGWVGKNTCLLNQQLGSWLLLGVIVTSLPVATGNSLHPAVQDRCGSCTRCIDACPTGALVAPREMDASRCIAYLTIEKKGSIAEDLRGAMGRQIFGCDICQEVCPWNRRAPVAVKEGMLTRRELINPALDWLEGMDAAEFKRWFKGSPLERTGRKRLRRNIAIAMGNSGQERFLPKLKAWIAGEDEILAESASWAADRIQSARSAQGI